MRVNEEAYDRLPVGWEDVDLEIARLRLDEIESRVAVAVRGKELRDALANIG